MSIWRWAEAFEPVPAEARITLGEGNTPLIRSRRLGRRCGLERLWLKLELCNPTGSYKDRFAAAAISDMRARGETRCIATSSGNTGSSLAAYCAAAGIRCEIAIVETAPLGKLQQMMAYGADIFRVRGFGLDADVTRRCFHALQRLAAQPGSALQISAFKYSPVGMSGVRSLSYELAETLGQAGGDVFCPAGGGGLTMAVAQGFQQLWQQRQITHLPRVHCVQPEGNNTIAGPLRDGAPRGQNVHCTTQVSGLQVATVVDGDEVIAACRSTGGTGFLVADSWVWTVQQYLAAEEGVFCEPAGAIAVAAAIQAAQRGELDPQADVVCLVTGVGFKDPPSVEKMVGQRSCPLIEPADLERRAAAP